MARSVHVSIRLPAELAEALSVDASSSGATVSELIRDAILLARGVRNTEERARLAREAAEAARTVERLAMDVAAAADASADALATLHRLTARAAA